MGTQMCALIDYIRVLRVALPKFEVCILITVQKLYWRFMLNIKTLMNTPILRKCTL